MQWDGKRDEIYGAAYWAKVSFNGNTTGATGYHKTLVHGDVNNLAGRIQAGTASTLGGIKSGDNVPSNLATSASPGIGASTDRFPLVLWEGQLTDSAESVVVVPAVFESDRKESPAWSTWTSWWTSPEGSAEIRDAARAGRNKSTLDWMRIGRIDPNGFEYGPRFDSNNGTDRPIGLRLPSSGSTGWWVPAGYVLTRELVEKTLGANQAVVMSHLIYDTTPLDGAYTMYLQLERR